MRVQDAIKTRMSIRRYADAKIPDKDMEVLLKALQLSPSANNSQNWEFVFVHDPDLKHTLIPACANQKFISDCTYFIAAVADPGLKWHMVDITIALTNLTLQAVELGYPATAFFNIPCQPPIIRSWHNHFDNYGNFMPGFCGGISLGSWFDLDRLVKEGVDLEKHLVLNYLINDDMKGLLHLAKDMEYKEISDGYVSKCHLCLDIRKHLAASSNYDELNPKEFYEQLKF